MLERIVDPILVLDRETRFFVDANSSAVELTGLDRQTLFRSQPDDLFVAFDGWIPLHDPVVDATDSLEPRQVELLRPDGTRAYVELHTGPVAANRRQVLVLVDISRRRAEEHRRTMLYALESLMSERQRLARDLHDGVIQDVIGTALALSAVGLQLPSEARSRLDDLIDVQDRIVRTIRSLVFDLAQPLTPSADPVMTIHDVVRHATPSIGFPPDTTVTGMSDHPPTAVLMGHLLLSLREMLSNVARHAEATAVQVIVRSDATGVEVIVTDNGVGFTPDSRRGNGLTNLAERAGSLGGTFTVSPSGESGTQVCWTAPY